MFLWRTRVRASCSVGTRQRSHWCFKCWSVGQSGGEEMQSSGVVDCRSGRNGAACEADDTICSRDMFSFESLPSYH